MDRVLLRSLSIRQTWVLIVASAEATATAPTIQMWLSNFIADRYAAARLARVFGGRRYCTGGVLQLSMPWIRACVEWTGILLSSLIVLSMFHLPVRARADSFE